jgi:flagellar basal-body rod protein FlgC
MGLDQALNISVDGINASRIHMEIISSNLANINTTRTAQGGPYRRKIPVFAEKPVEFSDALSAAERKMSGGIQVVDIAEDKAPLQKIYNPGHPDADADGYVSMPNVSMSKEMVDMVYVEKLYEANITAYNATKRMAQETLQIQ